MLIYSDEVPEATHVVVPAMVRDAAVRRAMGFWTTARRVQAVLDTWH